MAEIGLNPASAVALTGLPRHRDSVDYAANTLAAADDCDHCVGDDLEKPTKNCDLLSGAEARNPEFIIKLFKRLKGQPATAGESADLEREITAAARETKP